jgi:hypothetical protein
MKNILTILFVTSFVTLIGQQTLKISGSIGINTLLTKPELYIVTLNCLDSVYTQTTTLNSYGFYSFEAQKGKSYILSMRDKILNEDVLNGVSTLDMVLSQRHILGISVLNLRYTIASDVNLDGKVTAADIVDMRKLILGITTQFSGGQSWVYRSTANLKSSVKF